ncbi:MAG: TIM-barrel domain-containing protein [Armatimonadota bacterium]|nr:DUF5110 domain-containing protein [bacterium]
MTAILALMSSTAQSASSLVHYTSVSKSANSIDLKYEEGWARITAYDTGIFRVQVGVKGTKPVSGDGYAVVGRKWEDIPLTYSEYLNRIEIRSAELSISVVKSPFMVEFRDQAERVLTSSAPSWNSQYSVSRNTSGEDEHFFGFGLQFHKLDQRGLYRVIKTNADPPFDNGMAHASDPFFYSTRGYGIFLNSTGYSHFDMCCTVADQYTFSAPDPTLDYYFIYGPTFRDISDRQTWLRGRVQMPPKWGLGFWYRMPSKWKSDLTIDTAKEFRSRNIPCDVIGLEPSWQTGSYPCTYMWNKEFYPDPAGYVKWMRDNGFHVNLWEHEWVSPMSPIYNDLKTNHLFADKKAMGGAVPDFTLQKTRDIFTKLHIDEHIKMGVEGYKLDECDGSDFSTNWFYPDDTQFPSGLTGAQMHNLTGFLYNQTVQEMFEKLGLRTYLLLRANFAGGQRYASCIYSDYYQLEQYVRAQATSGFSGFLWCPELREAGSNDEFLRRAENMCFAPMAMINAWAGDEKLLPWKRDKSVEDTFRKYVQMRMRLLPYIYSAFWQMHTTGLPIVRALVMDYPDDKATYEVDNQYMFGESIMIAPLIEDTSRKIYLPNGTWTDFWTDHIYEGGHIIDYNAPADVLPMFVKAGAVIPMGPVMQHVGEKPVNEIELNIYPGEGSFIFYDDDGTTTAYEDGKYVELPIKVTSSSVNISKAKGNYLTEIKTFAVRVHGKNAGNERVPFGEEKEIRF